MHIDLLGVLGEGFGILGWELLNLGTSCVMIICCGICVLWAWQGQRGSHEALGLETGRVLSLGIKHKKLSAWRRYLYIIYKRNMMKWDPNRGCVWQEGLGPNALQGQELYCHGCLELGCEFTCFRGQLCVWLVHKEQKRKKKNPNNIPLSFCKVSVSTTQCYRSTSYRPVDSKTNTSNPLNKSIPIHNASTSLFSPDTWQFHLKTNWSCFEPLQALWEKGGHFTDLNWFL